MVPWCCDPEQAVLGQPLVLWDQDWPMSERTGVEFADLAIVDRLSRNATSSMMIQDMTAPQESSAGRTGPKV